ncbi:MAG: hypothetical protein QW272_08820 [Candidatus Methanomethylicaceae archaeon]
MSVDIDMIEKGIKYLAIALIGVILSLFSTTDFQTALLLSLFAIFLFLTSYFISRKIIEKVEEK